MTTRILWPVLLIQALISGVAAAGQDYCALNQGATVLFIVDRTDAFDDRDREDFVNGLDKLYHSLQQGDRLVIHTLTDDYGSSERVFDRCVPGCPEMSLFDGLMGKCRQSRARVDARKFQDEYLQQMERLIKTAEDHPASAIVETVSALSAEYQDQQLGRVVLFSDLIENSGLWRFQSLNRKESDRVLQKVKTKGLMPELTGTRIEVYGFGRSQGGQGRGLTPETRMAVEAFWRDYFQTAGAKHVVIKRYY